MLVAVYLVSSRSSGGRIRKEQLRSLPFYAAATHDVVGILVRPHPSPSWPLAGPPLLAAGPARRRAAGPARRRVAGPARRRAAGPACRLTAGSLRRLLASCSRAAFLLGPRPPRAIPALGSPPPLRAEPPPTKKVVVSAAQGEREEEEDAGDWWRRLSTGEETRGWRGLARVSPREPFIYVAPDYSGRKWAATLDASGRRRRPLISGSPKHVAHPSLTSRQKHRV
jgi:hypothetical protein